ncbi:hypothetical protein Taro_050378 [Colocasia esculenta]|uniref:Uncharacterized protein n=1 Tax=Colocasia esculenta TaxID=4460 RepID=A0A843XDR5_COLES|nr:hypothetical protein [Colocasia esculenta]
MPFKAPFQARSSDVTHDPSSASGKRHLPYTSVRPDPIRPNKEKVSTLLAPSVGTNERPCALPERLIFMRPPHPYPH